MNDLFSPLSTCLQPKKIINPYTKELMFVPCGKCKACMMNKNNRHSLLCDLESMSHKYTLFVTLTYANRFIPRAVLVDAIDRPFGHDLFDKDTGVFLGPADIPLSKIQPLLDKFYLFGDVPYLRKYDLQTFLKRFRKNVSKISSSKIRYFAVGEYGPLHYRPHFHLLLFFDDEAILSSCDEILLKSWPFGRIDAQLSKGKASQYVAQYINSANNLPGLFTLPATTPFKVHSQRLGAAFLDAQSKEVQELSARDFIRRSCVRNGKYSEFNLWRTYYNYFFPKCKGYFTKSALLRYESYTIYDRARSVFPDCETVFGLAQKIAFHIIILVMMKELLIYLLVLILFLVLIWILLKLFPTFRIQLCEKLKPLLKNLIDTFTESILNFFSQGISYVIYAVQRILQLLSKKK